jgi:hypothetical protein
MTQLNARCRTCQELSTDYLMAVDQAEEAAKQLSWAVTLTQQEGAATLLARLNGHRFYTMGELVAHCQSNGCRLPISEPALEDLLGTR